MAKTFADLATKVKPYLPDVPQPTLEEMCKRVIADFCELTMVLKVNADAITLLDSDSDYAITFGANAYTPSNIIRAKVGSTEIITDVSEYQLDDSITSWRDHEATCPTHVFLTYDKQARVYPTPSANLTDTLQLTCVVNYSSTYTTYADFLLADFWRVLVDGVIAESRDLPNRPFTDYGQAERYRERYLKGVARARWAIMKSYSLGSQDVDPVSFEGYF